MNRDRHLIIATLEALAEDGSHGPSDLLTIAESLASDEPGYRAQALGLDIVGRADEAMQAAETPSLEDTARTERAQIAQEDLQGAIAEARELLRRLPTPSSMYDRETNAVTECADRIRQAVRRLDMALL